MDRLIPRAVVLALLVLGACSVEPSADGGGLFGFDPFARPARYTVVAGDTLYEIARDHRVTVADLREWNGIEGDRIEIGQVLLVWEGHGGPAPKPPVARRAPAKDAPLVVEAAVVEVRPPPPQLRAPGVLGAMDEAGLSDDLDEVREATAQMGRYDGTSDGAGLWGARGDGLASSGAAEATATPRTSGRSAPSPYAQATFGGTSVRAPTLPDPPRKRCLAGPTDVLGDEGIAAGAGLTASQIRGALGSFVRHTAACVPSGSSGTVTVTTALTVGCDGRVHEAVTVDSGGAPAGVARCVADTLRQAPFPAHDLPDGMTFHYPVTLRF